MAAKSRTSVKASPTPDAKEKHLINLAMEEAEKQIKEGRASSSVIVHFLKLGASDYEKKLEMAEAQATLYKARADALEREKKDQSLAEEALAAMKDYGGGKK